MKARRRTKPPLFEFTSVFVSLVYLHRKECVHLWLGTATALKNVHSAMG